MEPEVKTVLRKQVGETLEKDTKETTSTLETITTTTTTDNITQSNNNECTAVIDESFNKELAFNNNTDFCKGDNSNSNSFMVENNNLSTSDVIQQCGKDEYLVKTIDWVDKKVQIITQNENGPCPLVAICNVLFLRGDIEIQPPEREVVTFEYLVDRLGDFLLNRAPTTTTTDNSRELNNEGTDDSNNNSSSKENSLSPDRQPSVSEFVLSYRHNLDNALSILPSLKSGLDVNVKFDSIRGFESTVELAMFDLFKVDLVHGWVVDPQDVETFEVVTKKCVTYNAAVECIVHANEINTRMSTDGLILTTEKEEKLHQGFIVNEFLKDTATQLTYYGLDLLLDSIPLGDLCVLFRNNHFSTIYRHQASGLYMLVTDSGLVLEKRVIWESLADIDQASSEFFDSNFNSGSGGISKSLQQKDNNNNNTASNSSDLDYVIAMSIQEEERKHELSLLQNQQKKQKEYSNNELGAKNSKNSNKSNKSSNCMIQ